MRTRIHSCTWLLVFATAVGARQGAQVLPVAQAITGRYIVALQTADDPMAVGLEVARLPGVRLRFVYTNALHGFAVEMPEADARTLAADPRVAFIEQDAVVRPASTVQTSPPWGLDRIDQIALPLDGVDRQSRDGSGVNAYVVDTGIRITHSEFGGRAFIAGDYVDDDRDGDFGDSANDDGQASAPDGVDCHGHGTHVAGIIGGATTGVAKGVTLWSHRVLDCDGLGSISAVIAAVDAITGDTTYRPAVAVLALAGPASRAMDEAVRQSIASGVTYVVAAGNGGSDASSFSPARVVEAITVGATSATDTRASFSNYGAVIDLFAVGVSIVSAGDSDATMATRSGTSMAAAHVAGVAALHLDANPASGPAMIQKALINALTPRFVSSAGAGSPNRLASSQGVSEPATNSLASVVAATVPSLSVTSPNTAVNWAVGSRQRIEWRHSLGQPSYVRIEVSRDGGATYKIIQTAVPNSGRHEGFFDWTVSAPYTNAARIRVSATTGRASDVSDARFTIAAPFISLTKPSSATPRWGYGTKRLKTWRTNLGRGDRLDVLLSTDGGQTFPTRLATGIAAAAESVDLVTPTLATATGRARLRIRWTNPPSRAMAQDTSEADFRIEPPFIKAAAPNGGEVWTEGATAPLEWVGNLGSREQVAIALSLDGGASYPVVLSTGTASDGRHKVTVSNRWVTNSGKVRFRWLKNARVSDVSNDTFRVSRAVSKNRPPAVSLTAPANGATYSAPATITLAASASDNDGTISRVYFYRGTTLIGSDTTSPYRVSWTNVGAGAYSLTAIAVDNDGASKASAARTIIVSGAVVNQPPTVSLSSPASGASYIAPASITLKATAGDVDGNITRIDFYQGATLIGADTTSPFTVTWSNVSAGSYSLTARAWDDDGANRRSAAVQVNVQTTVTRRRAVFVASPDHNTLVDSYLLEIFASSANPATAVPIASQNLGKPAVVGGECLADVTATLNGLPPGTYKITVASVNSANIARGAPIRFTH